MSGRNTEGTNGAGLFRRVTSGLVVTPRLHALVLYESTIGS